MKTLLLSLIIPLACFAHVTKGPGNTYNVDQWGSSMEPSKQEMGTDTRKHLAIHDAIQIPVSFKSHYAIPVR